MAMIDDSREQACKHQSQLKGHQQCAGHYQYNQLPCEIPPYPPKIEKEAGRVDFSFMMCGE